MPKTKTLVKNVYMRVPETGMSIFSRKTLELFRHILIPFHLLMSNDLEWKYFLN